MTRGYFISFEGGDGVGKTTQIRLLADYLRNSYDGDPVLTREPGGTPEAEALRGLLLNQPNFHWSGASEALLFYAARLHHLETLIDPSLAQGKIIITDRFADSTLAYQAVRSNRGRAWVKKLDKLVLAGRRPDLTLLLDLDVKLARQRLAARGVADDRLEASNLKEKQRLRQAFLRLAKAEPERIKIIDASQTILSIHHEICQHVDHHLKGVSSTLGAK